VNRFYPKQFGNFTPKTTLGFTPISKKNVEISGISIKENPPKSLTPGDNLVYSWL
jgi:hypothetical protein